MNTLLILHVGPGPIGERREGESRVRLFLSFCLLSVREWISLWGSQECCLGFLVQPANVAKRTRCTAATTAAVPLAAFAAAEEPLPTADHAFTGYFDIFQVPLNLTGHHIIYFITEVSVAHKLNLVCLKSDKSGIKKSRVVTILITSIARTRKVEVSRRLLQFLFVHPPHHR